MALTGTETLQVLGQNPSGVPAATTFETTTQEIANLAGVTGVPQIVLDGSSSGSTTIVPASVASGTVTVPAGTGTVAVRSASGTVTLNEATPVVVAAASVTADSIIIFTLKTVGGTVGEYPSIKTITPTTGFTVAGSASDTSIYNYTIIG